MGLFEPRAFTAIGARPKITWGAQRGRLEAEVGIEPAYTDLQSADTTRKSTA